MKVYLGVHKAGKDKTSQVLGLMLWNKSVFLELQLFYCGSPTLWLHTLGIFKMVTPPATNGNISDQNCHEVKMAVTCLFVFEVEAQKDNHKISAKHVDILMMNIESLGLEKPSKTCKSNPQHCQDHH